MTDTAPTTPPIRRALLSVSNKQGIVEFARALADAGVHLLSTGGTARTLRDAGLEVTLVEDHTGFPEMLDGRVKTLHPTIHGGILGVRDNPAHQAKMAEHNIDPIDLVCIDLYPFERTIAQHSSGVGVSPANGVTLEAAIEQIDIGGPAMLRSAAKNFRFVTVISDPAQYPRVLAELAEHGGTTLDTRMDLAAAAYERTCAFDAAISTYLRAQQGEPFPRVLLLRGQLASTLRYGENPHQPAALYHNPGVGGPVVAGAQQLHGKGLSYNNLLDASAALELAIALAALDETAHAACVIKHTNPCGAALAATPAEAFDLAIAGDPMAAYGGIAASGSTINTPAAERLCAPDRFFEVVIAPDYTDDALAILRARWKNIRILQTGPLAIPVAPHSEPPTSVEGSPDTPGALDARTEVRGSGSNPHLDIRTIPGGYLATTTPPPTPQHGPTPPVQRPTRHCSAQQPSSRRPSAPSLPTPSPSADRSATQAAPSSAAAQARWTASPPAHSPSPKPEIVPVARSLSPTPSSPSQMAPNSSPTRASR